MLQAIPVRCNNFDGLDTVRRITVRVATVILGLGIANALLAWNGISCILLIAQAALLLRLASRLTTPSHAAAAIHDPDPTARTDDCDTTCCESQAAFGAWGDATLATTARTIRALAISAITIACLEFIFGFAGGVGGSLLASNPQINCSVCASSFCAQCALAPASASPASTYVAADKQSDLGFYHWAVWMGGANLAVSWHNVAASVLVLQLLSELADARRRAAAPAT